MFPHVGLLGVVSKAGGEGGGGGVCYTVHILTGLICSSSADTPTLALTVPLTFCC